jgi:Ala-tRNA(Pro) deacylase
MEHEAVGKCEAVSEIRGTDLRQGAKALVCKVKGNGVKKHVLAILAADLQADLSQLASHFGGLKASLASPAEVDTLTACVSALSRPLASILIWRWLPTRCCSSALTKSRLTPACWRNP